MQIIELNALEAKKIIDEGAKCYLLLSHDLSHDKPLGKYKINKKKCHILITNSKTIILNKDEEDPDSFSILSLYSALQKDIYDIRQYGIKHDILLPPN